MRDYRFAIVVEKDKQGYFAYCPELQGCYTQGETFEETIENIKDAISVYLKMIKKETKGEKKAKVNVSA